MNIEGREPVCVFAHLGGCEGRLVRAHLIPKQSLRREIAENFWEAGDIRPVARARARLSVYDGRCWRWMCGGVTGIGGHHGAFDAKQLRLAEWPGDFLEFLREYDIEWVAEAYARS